MNRTYIIREHAEELIQRILDLDFVDDEEAEGEVLDVLERGLGCPHVITLIYHTTPELSVTEIVDRALACRPFVAGPYPSDMAAGTVQH